MRNLKVITILALFLVALSATTLLAQRRPENTRSAQAAYGYPAGGHKVKKSKKKKQKKPRKAKKQKSSPAYRKKNPWAN
jgi:hypothetical protein